MSRFIPGFVSRMFSTPEEVKAPGQTDADISYICPLSGQIMIDPVIASNGISYDRSAMESYLAAFLDDNEIPAPGDSSSKIERTLFPNTILKQQIRLYMEETRPEIMLNISHSISNTLYDDDLTKTLVLTIVPNLNAIQKKPAGNDVVIILDVSGSMETGVVSVDSDNGESGFKLTRLDLVKHATLATSKMLGPSDNLCIITYSTTAKVVLDFTPMNDVAKSNIEEILKTIRVESSTDFCPAIRCAFDTINRTVAKGRHVSVLFLTDGEPTDTPEQIMSILDNQMKNTPNTTFSTFIFGNNANSSLLKYMSEVGQGMYSFIPDVSMIGTVFSNFIANVKDTVIPFAEITIDTLSGFETITPNNRLQIFNIHSKTPKNICYRLKNSDKKDEPFEIRFTIDINNKKQLYKITSTEDTNVLNVAVQNMRTKFIKDITLAAESRDLQYSQKMADDLRLSIKRLLVSYPENAFLDGMLRDLESTNPDESQITKGFSQKAWFNSWGRHYALSVARANMLEETSNYKTPSIAPYANSEFIRIRDMADSTFVSIPPPEPSIKPYGRGTYTPSAAAASNLAANFYGGCVSADSIVETTRGPVKINQLKKGDHIVHSQGKSTVSCVVEHYVGRQDIEFATIGNSGQLKITSWHPIRMPGTTETLFPVHYQNAKITVEQPDSVFNIVMSSGEEPWYSIDGIDCVSVGHGKHEDPILDHPYYSSKILDDLKLLEGWEAGYVIMYGKKVRDKNSGKVIGML